jgi:hypothetical protein
MFELAMLPSNIYIINAAFTHSIKVTGVYS